MLFQLTDKSLGNTLLHQTADSVVDRVQIRTLRRPQIWCVELRCLLLQELDSLTCPVCLPGTQTRRLQRDA